MNKREKLDALGEEVGVKWRQAERYIKGEPVPGKRVYYMVGTLGGDLDLWLNPGRTYSKIKLFNEWAA